MPRTFASDAASLKIHLLDMGAEKYGRLYPRAIGQPDNPDRRRPSRRLAQAGRFTLDT